MRKPSVRLRLLTGGDADWVVEVDRTSAGATAAAFDWIEEKLRAELDEGSWATEDRVAWGVTVDDRPVGFALVSGLASGSAEIEMRIRPTSRGQGVGRQVLARLADHHFADDPELRRLGGRTHELNVPMQRAFVAAGFRMEARYRDSYEQPDGGRASEWGYALTRSDWAAGRTSPPTDFDLHGRAFVLDAGEVDVPETIDRVVVKLLQEGRRVLGRYSGGPLHDGEAAGLLLDDVLTIRFVHDLEVNGGQVRRATGLGRGRVQRLQDGRLELLFDMQTDDGREMQVHLTERQA